MASKKQKAAGKRLARRGKCARAKAIKKFGKKASGAPRRKPTKKMWAAC